MVEPRICEGGTGDKSNPTQNETGVVERLLQKQRRKLLHLPRLRFALREGRNFSAPLPFLCNPRPRFPAEVLPR